jgi:hypothetical protein
MNKTQKCPTAGQLFFTLWTKSPVRGALQQSSSARKLQSMFGPDNTAVHPPYSHTTVLASTTGLPPYFAICCSRAIASRTMNDPNNSNSQSMPHAHPRLAVACNLWCSGGHPAPLLSNAHAGQLNPTQQAPCIIHTALLWLLLPSSTRCPPPPNTQKLPTAPPCTAPPAAAAGAAVTMRDAAIAAARSCSAAWLGSMLQLRLVLRAVTCGHCSLSQAQCAEHACAQPAAAVVKSKSATVGSTGIC